MGRSAGLAPRKKSETGLSCESWAKPDRLLDKHLKPVLEKEKQRKAVEMRETLEAPVP
jgi:hypothetical protein